MVTFHISISICNDMFPLFKFIYNSLSQIKTEVSIYTGEGAKPYTFSWIVTSGVLIIVATYLGGLL